MELNRNSSRKNLKNDSSSKLFFYGKSQIEKKFEYNLRPNNFNQPLYNQVNSRSTLKVPSTYLPPLNHKSSSKDLDGSQSIDLDLSYIERKPRASGLKQNSVIHSSSEQLIRRTPLSYLPKLEENSNFDLAYRRNSNESTQVFTPTFRNISCDRESSRGKVEKKSKVNESSIIFPVSQKKILEIQSKLKPETSGLAISKTVKKIKVLHHKFPKDVFVVNGKLNNPLS